MIDIEAQTLRFRIWHNKKGYAAGAAVCLAALAAVVYFGKFYTGWIGIPGTEDLFFIDRGDFLENTWVQQADGYLYADENAQMSRGMMTIDDDIYVFGGDGRMLTGWLDTENGLLHLRSSGKADRGWGTVDGVVYYFDRDGIMQTGWLQLEDAMYYLEEDGARVTGWKDSGECRYYFGPDGAMQTGWVNIDGAWYLMADSGEMLTGDQRIGGKSYHLNDDGTRYYGWLDTEDGKRYYLESGEAAEGWIKIDGEEHYFGDDLLMRTGSFEIDGEKYYLEEDGTVAEGWHEVEEDSEDEDPENDNSENEDPENEDFYVLDDGSVLDFDAESGDFGRLVIRKAGIDVAVYTAKEREEYQPIVDEENSAVAVKERRDMEYVIADRRSQGFDLKDVEEGDSAYLIRGREEIMKYICSHTCIGTNTGEDIVDEEENSLFRQNEGGLCAYSSAGLGDPSKVLVTFWNPDVSQEEEPE